jgi:hypothetical protein
MLHSGSVGVMISPSGYDTDAYFLFFYSFLHLLSPVTPPFGLIAIFRCSLSLHLSLDAVSSIVPFLSPCPLRLFVVLYVTHS